MSLQTMLAQKRSTRESMKAGPSSGAKVTSEQITTLSLKAKPELLEESVAVNMHCVMVWHLQGKRGIQ